MNDHDKQMFDEMKQLVKKLKKWTQPDKELDKKLKEEKENKRSSFQKYMHGSTLSNIPAINYGVKIAIVIFIIWFLAFSGIPEKLYYFRKSIF